MAREFYNSYSFHPPIGFHFDTPDILRFKMKGRIHRFSLDDFIGALGFEIKNSCEYLGYVSSLCDYHSDFDPLEVYRDLIGIVNIAYDPSKSKANLIQNASLRYILRFLPYS